MEDPLAGRQSPAKLRYGCHADYKPAPFVFLDRLEQRIAKMQLPINIPSIPAPEAEGLEYSDELLMFMAAPTKTVAPSTDPPRYNLSAPSNPDEPLSKRKKLSD